MDSENTVCPVCTLYLRPGITLKAHLTSHPKQKVIDALVNLTNCRNEVKEVAVPSPSPPEIASNSQTSNQNWNQPSTGFPPMPTPAGNHSFIYQQFMSTSSQPPPNVVNVNPLAQQYITIPAVFNPQMMCQPYLYHQQQQVIMSAGSAASSLPPLLRKPAVIDLSNDNLPHIEHNDTGLPVDGSVNTMEMEDDDEDALSIKELSKDDENEADVMIVGEQMAIENEEQLNGTSLNMQLDMKLDQKLEETDEKKEEKEEVSDLMEDDPLRADSLHEDQDPLHEDQDPLQEDHIDDNLGSPASSTGSDYLRVRTDLNKACQTQQLAQINNVEDLNLSDDGNQDDSAYFTSRSEDILPTEVIPLQGSFDHNDMNYPPNNINVVQPNDQVIDMDGMQLVLCNDFMGSQLISQVEDFECISNRTERTVLMNIGGMDGGFANAFGADSNVNVDHLGEESISHESTNMSIRADEHMPPRGELSGQESNGAASDIAWSRMQYEGSSATSTSYDLLARETWEGSDCSDSEVPPLQSRIPPHILYSPEIDDTPTIVSVTEPPLNFKCPICGLGFKCPKERRVHQTEVHSDRTDDNSKSSISDKIPSTNTIIGSKLTTKKPVKKLIIKPKKAEIKSENNFDNVFTNRLKLDAATVESNEEREEERASVIAGVTPECDMDDKKDVKYCACHVCDSVFPDSRSLKRHKLQLHGKSYGTRYKCDTCSETLLNEVKYNEHLRKHPLECRLCGKYFYRRQNMQLHMKRHLGIKPYVCEFCQKSFLTKQKLDEHKNIHTGEAPIKCNMCDETFKRHSNLVQHRNRHHLNIKKKVKDYICFCGEILHSKKKLAWHKEIHDSKPKACSQCSEKFIHMASLTRHMRRAHNERFVPKEERSTENVECPICKGVYLRSSLEVHIRNHSGQRPFTCMICNKDFTTKWNLKLHKWTHAARASKPFKCDQCKGAFIRESDYVAHMNSHKSVRPYTCNHCGAQFIRKYNCQRHVREHEKAKTFSCQVCGKTFHRSYYLKDHMRVHSGLRPFSCHICGKTSTTKSNHNKHVMIHHAKEPVSTEN